MKILSLVVIVGLACSLAFCNQTKDNRANQNSKPTNTEQPEPTANELDNSKPNETPPTTPPEDVVVDVKLEADPAEATSFLQSFEQKVESFCQLAEQSKGVKPAEQPDALKPFLEANSDLSQLTLDALKVKPAFTDEQNAAYDAAEQKYFDCLKNFQ